MVDLSKFRLVRVPERFSSELDSVQEFGNHEFSDDLKRKIKLFYGYLIERQSSLRKFEWIYLKSTYLRKKIHQRHYRVGIMYLVANEYIEEDESYLPESYSKSFRINEENFDASGKFIELPEYPSPDSLPDSLLCPSLPTVTFSPNDLEELNKLGGDIKDGKRTGWKRFCWDMSLNKIIQKNWMITSDEKTGRMFTNVTSMPKEMRRLIRLDGEPTVEIDISNSQPYFAISTYPSDTDEKKKYTSLVTSGNFYKTLKDGLTSVQKKRIKTRDRLKERVYQEVFFGMDSQNYSLWKVFKGLFPELGKIFSELKKPVKKGERKSNRLSLMLQKAEADVVIRGVLAECIREKIPLLTVHDSVICKKSDTQKVLKKFEAHLLKAVGVLPKMKIVP